MPINFDTEVYDSLRLCMETEVKYYFELYCKYTRSMAYYLSKTNACNLDFYFILLL